ncbi:HTH-type transcriptional regulator AlsR [Mycolicibacterium mageritense DSM 44476 = CIP 104973]|uniref:Probable hydrogen peroxide-inducible genes activator n=1 Tax=Mycolicibacterium mageritense TaxID=53462 RepID=A0AAI8XPX9_MYCME|nr:LysR substrate-binding domain-containing protein [Mycolicibacterium mageritense]MBN3453034.1 LysR family transcriptional regulator [Mycobacterium sp. DSM 3803]OKH61637.1 LysR family transcriptional regulator [Mycobacterium sp. SWH-M3]MCC9186819.1 LysR substrate-binding domain-containing protein [Mycolicibacterium mageritense]TXI58464.1 MAG: LysR family transcriptional regulator [Mycolicibacterium mageritense]CDO19971.1 HTH-type transcriptional regulator AlsR [Mycolicibacterium mageritense D
MELRHLRYFVAVGEELHFGRAADRLHIAQPPLSQQIRQLERELGVSLLTRTTRSVELTPAGRAYLQRAIEILDAVGDAGGQARRIAAGVEGRLVIGCVGSATYSLLPQLVRALGESLPGVEVGLRGEMLAPAQLEALRSGALDLALLRPPVVGEGIFTETVRRDRLLVALPTNHSLAGQTELTVAALRDEDFVVHAGHGRSTMSNLVENICADAGFVPRVRQEVSETSTLVTLVAAGLGVAIVPDPTAALDIAGVRYVPLAPAALGIDLVAAGAQRSPLIDNVLAVLRDVAHRV